MKAPQFSLLTLGGMVAYCSIACAALVYASEKWSIVLFTAAIVLLIAAILLATYRAGATRAFWIGAAVFGWTYLVVIFWPSSERVQFGSWYKMELGTELATSHLARWAYEHILPKLRTPPTTNSVQQSPNAPGGGGGGFFPQFGGGGGGGAGVSAFDPTKFPQRTYPDESTFVRVAHALWTWFFLLVGGVFARYLHTTRPS